MVVSYSAAFGSAAFGFGFGFGSAFGFVSGFGFGFGSAASTACPIRCIASSDPAGTPRSSSPRAYGTPSTVMSHAATSVFAFAMIPPPAPRERKEKPRPEPEPCRRQPGQAVFFCAVSHSTAFAPMSCLTAQPRIHLPSSPFFDHESTLGAPPVPVRVATSIGARRRLAVNHVVEDPA